MFRVLTQKIGGNLPPKMDGEHVLDGKTLFFNGMIWAHLFLETPICFFGVRGIVEPFWGTITPIPDPRSTSFESMMVPFPSRNRWVPLFQ